MTFRVICKLEELWNLQRNAFGANWNDMQISSKNSPRQTGWWTYLLLKLSKMSGDMAPGIEGIAHLKQHSFWMAIFSFRIMIFKIAFQVVIDNNWKIHIAPFSAANFSHMTFFFFYKKNCVLGSRFYFLHYFRSGCILNIGQAQEWF